MASDSVTDLVSLSFSDAGAGPCELGMRFLFGGGKNSGGLAPYLLASDGLGGGFEACGRRLPSACSDSARLCRGGDPLASGRFGRVGRSCGRSDVSCRVLVDGFGAELTAGFFLRLACSDAAYRRASTSRWTGGGGK